MRHIFQSHFKDGQGRVISGATVTVYLTNTTTIATIYSSLTGGSPVTSVTTAADGSFAFYVSDSDFSLNQKFKITLTKTDFATKSYDNITIFAPVPTAIYYVDANETDQGAVGNGYSLKDIIDAAGSNNVTIKFRNSSGSATTSYTLTTSETIPATCAIELEQGAKIVQGGTATLTINGPVVGKPMHQWLSGFAADTIVFNGGIICPEWFGAKGDGDGIGGGTNDYIALQLGLNIINLRVNATTLKFNKRIYRCDSKLTMISSETGGNRHTNVRIIEGNGVIIDFSASGLTGTISQTFRNILLNIGTEVNISDPASPECIIEQGLLKVSDLKIIGPEIRRPDTPDATIPLTATVGLRLQLASDVQLNNIIVTDCTAGYETKDSFPINANNVIARNCWIGRYILGGSTIAQWIGFSAVQCAYATILQSSTISTSPIYGYAASISDQTFSGDRVEDCWYAYVIYPHDAAIRNIRILDTYGEGTLYDFAISGFAFNIDYIGAPASTLTTPTSVIVDRLFMFPGKAAFNGASGSYKLLRVPLSPDANHAHCKLTLPGLTSDISGTFLKSIIELIGNDTGNAGVINITDNSGNNVMTIDAYNQYIRTNRLYIDSEGSGITGTILLTNTTEDAGGGASTLPTSDATHGPSNAVGDGWVKLFVGTQTVWVPYWND